MHELHTTTTTMLNKFCIYVHMYTYIKQPEPEPAHFMINNPIIQCVHYIGSITHYLSDTSGLGWLTLKTILKQVLR